LLQFFNCVDDAEGHANGKCGWDCYGEHRDESDDYMFDVGVLVCENDNDNWGDYCEA
jgi:hypothetical protein